MINVCVPVLNRYDLLGVMIGTLNRSEPRPTAVYVIDNGQKPDLLWDSIKDTDIPVHVHRAPPMGLAESWNWFIENVPEERVITNDDVEFAPHSLAAMAAEKEAFVSCTYGFSCFLLRDACVRAVGLFDESISPGYAYFEDMDYLRRMKGAGVVDKVVECGVVHARSGTYRRLTSAELNEHHRKFAIAKRNYERKWASEPSWDQLRVIGGAGANA